LLHGGFSACLVDSVSTMALISHPRQVPGVSVNLNVM
jgi:acyl-coenzyme A thioesterase PaaI-like protein